MTSTKSKKKTISYNLRNRLINKRYRTLLKNYRNELISSINNDDELFVIKNKLNSFTKIVDRAAHHKVIHKNRANNLKSIASLKFKEKTLKNSQLNN